MVVVANFDKLIRNKPLTICTSGLDLVHHSSIIDANSL